MGDGEHWESTTASCDLPTNLSQSKPTRATMPSGHGFCLQQEFCTQTSIKMTENTKFAGSQQNREYGKYRACSDKNASSAYSVATRSNLEARKQQLWNHFIAGGIAGAVSRTCTAPLDRLKMIFQSQAGDTKMSVMNGLRYMKQEGGLRSMWRGNGVNVLKITPESALYHSIKFLAWDAAKGLLYSKEEVNAIPGHERFAAGAIAGVTAQFSIFPLEVVKTRLATARTGEYRGMLDCISKMANREGYRAFYRGLLPAIIGVIPYAGIDLAVYEFLKTNYAMHQHKQENNVLVFLACGAVSSMCGQLASYPLALVRTRLQAHPHNKNGMLQELLAVITKGGIQALYRGILVNFMKVVPAVSISSHPPPLANLLHSLPSSSSQGNNLSEVRGGYCQLFKLVQV
eukprot:gene11223-7831_t